jgi:hypothetical protein
MKRLIAVLLLAAGACLAQAPTPVPIKVCWTPEGKTETCYTVQPGDVAIVTVDGRSRPVQAVVVQPIPAYQLAAMQSHVDGQVYNMQKPDGTFEVRARFSSIQSLLMENMVRRMIVPALLLYPSTGENAGKNTVDVVTADLKVGELVAPIL